jgi:glycosyltransferase involved in cell wall biosynthesis
MNVNASTSQRSAKAPGSTRPAAHSTAIRLIVGPANFAGQGTQWARAVQRHLPDVGAHSFSVLNGVLDFPADYSVAPETYRFDRPWQLDFEQFMTSTYSHAIIEANRPLFGPLHGTDASHDIPILLKAGLNVALLSHGSDARIPSIHVELERWSPFPDMDDKVVNNLEETARRSVELYTSFPGPVFVSTPDLLDFIPDGKWCPVVVALDVWSSGKPVMDRERPIVAHAPNKSAIKGSDLIDPILSDLAHEGLIEYRRVENVDPADMPDVYCDSDIVVDQVRLGSYGVAACEAMAAGRVVLGHVADHVRQRILDATGLELPIVEVTPDTLGEVVRGLVVDRDRARAAAEQGAAFVGAVHDGRRSAAVLEPFLRQPSNVPPDWKPEWVGPRVAMLAGNDIVIDSRVLKYAHTVAQWGFEVTAVGIAGKYARGARRLGRVQVRCPAVPPRISGTGWRVPLAHLSPWYSDKEQYDRALGRWAYDSRELRGDRGRDRRDALRQVDPSAHRQGRLSHLATRVGRAVRWRSLLIRRLVIDARARPLNKKLSGSDDLGVGAGRRLAIRAYRRLPWGRWRSAIPKTMDREMILGTVLDQLQPDIIHVHDVFMLGIGARAAHRAALDGRKVKLVYDAHEYIPGIAVIPARLVAGYCDLEREFIADADRVITVSEPLARWLYRDHHLDRVPDVVLNAPVEVPDDARVRDLRDVVGLPPEVPLLAYCGGVNRARGVGTALEALPYLPGVHLAAVARENNPVVLQLQERAAELGVADRFHVAPYVDPELVPSYLRTVTIGISPLLHAPNHDIAVTNKFCEYIAAGIPIVTSDTPAQADLVTKLDLGGVHRAGDVADFARVVRQVLADRDRIARRIAADDELRHRFSWAAQAEVIRDVYHDLLGELPEPAWRDGATTISRLISEPPGGTALRNRLRAARAARAERPVALGNSGKVGGGR